MNGTENVFDIKKVLKKIVEELNIKIDFIRRKGRTEKERLDKKDFWAKCASFEIDFPIGKDTYYSYTSFVNKKKFKKDDKYIRNIDLGTFFEICKYTNVSADYLLGFTDTKRKDPSAERVRQDFGLSDKAMETLSIIRKNNPEVKGELSSDIVNLIFENQDFWQKLNDRLPVYLSNVNYSRADIDVNVARYGLSRAFEELIDDICRKLENDGLPHEELDNTSIFSS